MFRLSRALGSLLLLAGMAACGAPAAAPSPTAPPAAPTAAPTTAPAAPTAAAVPTTAPAGQTVELRLGISLDAATLADYEPAIKALDEQHPEWEIKIEQVPQQDRLTKLNAQIASQTLPDVVLIDGLPTQQFIRQGAFADLTPFIEQDSFKLDAFYPDAMAQFAYNGRQWGIVTVAAPEVVFYNKTMFDAAKMAYPTDDWTFEDMRVAARKLTLDKDGRNADDPQFDGQNIVQWGWNNSPGYIWTNHFVQPFGADYCANDDCTELQLTDSKVIEAFQWWADMVQKDRSALHDPYGGSQTGVPGDPLIASKAAMGFGGFFTVAQISQQTKLEYDIVQPFKGSDGKRYTNISTQGYLIAANSQNKEAAWQLIRALNQPDFLTNVWGKPGHFIPALREAAPSAINPAQPPKNQQAFIDAMEYAQVLRPYTASAFEVYGKTVDLFKAALTGNTPVPEALKQINDTANELLKKDRQP
jgi:multiple sugar transport system substrate-binding protein